MHALTRRLSPRNPRSALRPVAFVGTGLLSAVAVLLGADTRSSESVQPAPIEARFRTVSGEVRLTNSDPEFVRRLEIPGGWGFGSLTVHATAVGNDGGPEAQVQPTVTGGRSTRYSLDVRVGESDAEARDYLVQAIIGLDADRQWYHTKPRRTGPLIAGPADATLDLAECLGALRLEFVDAHGNPARIEGGTGYVYEGTDLRSIVAGLPPAGEERWLLVPAEVPISVALQVRLGSDPYFDEIQHPVTVTTNVPCDAVVTLRIPIPDPTGLGRIHGTVDMDGEFEWSTGPSPVTDRRGRTAIIGTGPAGNRRYALVPGEGVAGSASASGDWTLDRLLPSDATEPPEPWRLHAELQFRKGRRFEYFVSPALGAGANPGVRVRAGTDVSLGDAFQFRPGTIAGRLRLVGPPEIGGAVSALRGLERPDDGGVDARGVPLGVETYGIHASHVVANGVDEPGPGTPLGAAGGRAAANFEGAFDPATGSFDGDYELVVSGLGGEPSVWRRDELVLTIGTASGVPGAPRVNQVITVTDLDAAPWTVVPGTRVGDPIELGFGEVRLRLRTPGRRLYLPTLAGDQGSFTGTDYVGRPRDYRVRIDAATGDPDSAEVAAAEGLLTLCLPEGDYVLRPSARVLADDGSETIADLGPVSVRVRARERLGIETCFRLDVRLPASAHRGKARVTGTLETCGHAVGRLEYRVDDSAEVTVPILPGTAEEGPIQLDFPVALPDDGKAHRLTVQATSVDGAASSVSGRVEAGPGPLRLTCPESVILETDSPCGTAVFYGDAARVEDGQPDGVRVEYFPSSGSSFPIGTTEVRAVATNGVGERAECRFEVILGGPSEPPILNTLRPASLGRGTAERVSLLGAGLLPADEVRVGGRPVTAPTWIEPGEITWELPAALDAGAHDVTLWRCGEPVATLVNGLLVEETRPTLTGIGEPGAEFASVGGSRMTFLGRGLMAGQRVRVVFGSAGLTDESDLLGRARFAADGSQVVGDAPALPPGELPGPKTVQLLGPDGAVLSTLVGAITYLPEAPVSDPRVMNLRRFQTTSTVPARVRMRDGFPTRLSGRVRVAAADLRERARTFVRDYAPLLRMRDTDRELVVAGAEERAFGRVTLRQEHLGVPVHGASMVVLADGPDVFHAQGFLVASAVLSARIPEIRPGLSADAAEARVRAARAPMPSVQLVRPSRLAIFDRGVWHEGTGSDPRLVWRVEYRGARQEHFVDARTGEIVFRRPTVLSSTGRPLPGYELDLLDAMGRLNADDDGCLIVGTSPQAADEQGLKPGYVTHPVAPLLADWSREVYGFFHRHFGRESYDDDGGVVRVVMNSSMPAGYGAWFHHGCELIEFVPGRENVETFAHEFTHAVVSESSELEYVLESGALNEHYADMMGILLGRELGQTDWLYADQNLGGLAPSRDIANPANPAVRNPQPTHYANRFQLAPGVDPDDDNDWGGVHVNSGIANLAAYRLVTGVHLPATNGAPAISIAGIGEAKGRQLFYLALTGLPSDATFQDARDFEIALVDYLALRGLLGFTGSDACDVRNAWASVGVGPFDAGCDAYDEADTDRDGVADYRDNCPTRANPDQIDRDLDGVGDACDNCVASSNRDQKDLDRDGIGDVCDMDRDGDGCTNDAQDPVTGQYRYAYREPGVLDHHPDRAMQVIGYNRVIAVTACLGGEIELLGFEGIDTDGDGTPDCGDRDDDNDSLQDASWRSIQGGGVVWDNEDRCPVTPTPALDPWESRLAIENPLFPDECTTVVHCSGSQPTVDLPPDVADGGIFVRFGQHVNPNPEGDFLWDGVRLEGDRVVIDPGPGLGLAGLTGRLSALGTTGGRALHRGGNPEPLRVELWARGRAGGAPRLVRVLGMFDPGTTPIRDAATGALLVLEPAERFDAPVRLAGAWLGVDAPGSATTDSDRDGMPDAFEIRVGFNPHDGADGLADADGDGRRNFEEFLGRTDPWVPDAVVPRLVVERRTDGRLRLAWDGGSDTRLQRTRELGSARWEDVPGTDGVGTVEVDTSEGTAFYRVVRPTR